MNKLHFHIKQKRKWVFLYAWFHLYVKNKPIRNSMFEEFEGTFINENDIFSEEIKVFKNIDDDLSDKSVVIEEEDLL